MTQLGGGYQLCSDQMRDAADLVMQVSRNPQQAANEIVALRALLWAMDTDFAGKYGWETE